MGRWSPRPSSGSASEHGRTATSTNNLGQGRSRVPRSTRLRRHGGSSLAAAVAAAWRNPRGAAEAPQDAGSWTLSSQCTSHGWRMAPRKHGTVRDGARSSACCTTPRRANPPQPWATPVHHPRTRQHRAGRTPILATSWGRLSSHMGWMGRLRDMAPGASSDRQL